MYDRTMGKWIAATVVLLSIVGTIQTAHAAGWYYDWQCTGKCSPGQLGISGVEGPFASEDQCNSVRDGDGRKWTFIAEGNLGGLGSCIYHGDQPAGSSGSASSSSSGASKARFTRVSMAMATTPGWTFERPNGSATQGQPSVGFEFEAHIGRAEFGIDLVAGLHGTTVAAPFLSADDAQVTIAVALVGLSFAPFPLVHSETLDVRPTLGVYAGLVGPIGCVGDCTNGAPSGFGLRGKVGLDFYIGRSRRPGVSLELVVDSHQLGIIDSASPPEFLRITAPSWMLRFTGFYWLVPNPVWRSD